MIDIVSDDASAPLIEDQTEAAAGVKGGREIAAGGIETEIEVADRHRASRFAGRGDVAAVAAVEAVNAIVETPAQAIHVAVGHTERESFQDHFAHIGFAVTVC